MFQTDILKGSTTAIGTKTKTSEVDASSSNSKGGHRMPVMFNHKMICAPMVGGSELPFRMLCRKYGADLCYTPMLYSDKFVNETGYAEEQFFSQLKTEDRPLVAHFCGNDPETLLKAGKMVQNFCDAIDLNLGCPQRAAHSGHFGAYLLGEEDRNLLKFIVRTMSKGLRVPICAKIRLLDTTEQTIKLCRDLKRAGCSMIAIHARERGTATRRREGPADLAEVEKVKRALGEDFPIIANGNVRTQQDVVKNIDSTRSDGIMSAEGLLNNPALFYGLKPTEIKSLDLPTQDEEDPGSHAAEDEEQKDEKPEKKAKKKNFVTLTPDSTAPKAPERPQLALEYLDLAEKFPPPPSEKGDGFSTVVFHTRRMCREPLKRLGLFEKCVAARTIEELREIVTQCLENAEEFDYEKAKANQQAALEEAKKSKDGKKFEARMTRKAKQQGRSLEEVLAEHAKKSDWIQEKGK